MLHDAIFAHVGAHLVARHFANDCARDFVNDPLPPSQAAPIGRDIPRKVPGRRGHRGLR